jgi:putative sigma-54 modulation protein
MKIQIQSLHFDADKSLKEFINKKIEKLQTFYDKIIDSDVVLSLEQLNTQVRDKVVVIKTNIPGTTLIAKEKSKKFEAAVDLAVESLKKQLEKIKTKQLQQQQN